MGTPNERSKARRQAQDVAQEYEAAARKERTEAQIRKTMTEIFNAVNPARHIEWKRVRPYLTNWLTTVEAANSKGTHDRYESVINRFLECLGDRAELPLGELNTGDFQNYINLRLKAGRRAGTLRLELKVLNAPMANALQEGAVIVNPAVAAKIPEHTGESKRPFTLPQCRALVAACAPSQWPAGDRVCPRLPDWKTAIMLGAFCGFRLGDTCNLRWSQVKLQDRAIEITPEKTRRKKREPIRIPVHPSLIARLLEVAGSDAPDAFVTPSLAGVRIGGRAGLSRQFQRIMNAAGIDNEVLSDDTKGARKFNALGFHSLRHYYVSALANAGVPQDLRMALAGHSSANVNEIYTHRGQATLAEAVAKLPGI